LQCGLYFLAISDLFFFVWNQQNVHGRFTNKKYVCKYIKTSKIGAMLRFLFFSFASQGVINEDPTAWLVGARSANTCILPSFSGNAPAQPSGIPNSKIYHPNLTTHSLELGNYLLANSLNVKNVTAEYSVMEIWEKVLTGK
jgi:hypothetical protein